MLAHESQLIARRPERPDVFNVLISTGEHLHRNEVATIDGPDMDVAMLRDEVSTGTPVLRQRVSKHLDIVVQPTSWEPELGRNGRRRAIQRIPRGGGIAVNDIAVAGDAIPRKLPDQHSRRAANQQDVNIAMKGQLRSQSFESHPDAKDVELAIHAIKSYATSGAIASKQAPCTRR